MLLSGTTTADSSSKHGNSQGHGLTNSSRDEIRNAMFFLRKSRDTVAVENTQNDPSPSRETITFVQAPIQHKQNPSAAREKANEVFGHILATTDAFVICKLRLPDNQLIEAELPLGLFDEPQKAVYGAKFSLSIDSSTGYKKPVITLHGLERLETPQYKKAAELIANL